MEHVSDITMLDLLGGHIDAPQKRGLLEHISGCDDCRRRWESFGQTWNDLGHLDVDASDVDVFAEIAGRISSGRRRPRVLPIRTYIRAAASIALAIILGHILGKAGTHRAKEDPALAFAQAKHLDALAPSSSTGWGEPMLQEGSSESEQQL